MHIGKKNATFTPMTAIFRTKLREVGLREVARQLDVSPTAVRFWACGERRPSPAHAEAVATILSLPMKDVRPDLARMFENEETAE